MGLFKKLADATRKANEEEDRKDREKQRREWEAREYRERCCGNCFHMEYDSDRDENVCHHPMAPWKFAGVDPKKPWEHTDCPKFKKKY